MPFMEVFFKSWTNFSPTWKSCVRGRGPSQRLERSGYEELLESFFWGARHHLPAKPAKAPLSVRSKFLQRPLPSRHPVAMPEPHKILIRSPEDIPLQGPIHVPKVLRKTIASVIVNLRIRTAIFPPHSAILPHRPVRPDAVLLCEIPRFSGRWKHRRLSTLV